VSGIKIFSMGEGFSRRNRVIISCALALGLGVTMVPQVGQVVVFRVGGFGDEFKQ
jgi:xanthine/uracil permease